MVKIPCFRKKWDFYKRENRCWVISAKYFIEDKVPTQEDVAGFFPTDSSYPFPANDIHHASAGSMNKSAFGQWLAKDDLPDDRIAGFTEMTGLGIEVWMEELARFHRSVQTEAGEIVGWKQLLRERPSRDNIAILLRAEGSARTRFLPEGARVRQPSAQPFKVWPGCFAEFVVTPSPVGPEIRERRVWLLSWYPGMNRTFVLDPSALPDGTPSPTRSGAKVVRLPREPAGYGGIPKDMAIDTEFDVIALVFALDSANPAIVRIFNGLERLMLKDSLEPESPDRDRAVIRALDEAADTWSSEALPLEIFRRSCLVRPRKECESQ